jgi:hypothetical protein
MGLLTGHTHWMFLLPATPEAEERHIYDVAYGVFCLEKKGISPETITIIIDGDKKRITALLQIASVNQYQIYNSSDIDEIFRNNKHDNIILFVTGHGSINGLASNPPIKPYPFLHAIRIAPNIKCGVVYLGQCYAGIFNYMNVKNFPKKGMPQTEAPLVIIGATNLYESISTKTTEMFTRSENSWSANMFLLNLFQWILNPVDVDGDGKYTVIDSYKCAGINTNDLYKKIKSSDNIRTRNITFDIDRLIIECEGLKRRSGDKTQEYMIKQLQLHALIKTYEDSLNIRFNHQEPWILNATLAQKIEF